MMGKDWFKHWFDSPYYDMLYHCRNEEEAKGFIELLIAHLQPRNGATMVDVACGKGRHSKCLADMGFDVTAFDLSAVAIETAKKFENEHLHFYLHDMRSTFWINYFEYAFNFFTSFGYFNTRREDDDAMRTMAQSLKSNGILVIDYLNVHYIENNFVESEQQTIDDIQFKITRWHDDKRFFKKVETIDEAGNLEYISTEKVSKFSVLDFTGMLAKQNMHIQEVFGDYKLNSYDEIRSPRMIIVAKKNDSI